MKILKKTTGVALAVTAASLLFAMPAFAEDAKTIGEIATTITGSFSGLAKLITAGALIAGMGFVVSSFMKFKAHKDNPQQIPIGTPIALLFIGAGLMFITVIFKSAGQTIFGSTDGGGTVKGTSDIFGGGSGGS